MTMRMRKKSQNANQKSVVSFEEAPKPQKMQAQRKQQKYEKKWVWEMTERDLGELHHLSLHSLPQNLLLHPVHFVSCIIPVAADG